MKAARLHDGATKLVLEEHPDPKPRPGAAVVRLQSAFMSASLAGVVRGTSHYETPPRPFTPGMDAVGTIASLGEGVSGLEVGDPIEVYLGAIGPIDGMVRWVGRNAAGVEFDIALDTAVVDFFAAFIKDAA